MRRSGYSLLEILVALALLSMLLVAVSLAFAPRLRSANVRGAAEALSGLLAEARQRAITRATPVAVVVPSGDGSTAAASKLYLAEGWQHPIQFRVVNLAREFPGVWVFAGHWAPATGSPQRAANLSLTANHAGFSAQTWGLPAGDRAIIFLPSGSAIGNGLSLAGELPLVVLAGYQTSPESLDGVASFRLEGVQNPYSVRVAPSGRIKAEPGVFAAAAMPDVAAGQAQPPPAGAAPAPTGQSAPHDLVVKCYPRPSENLPPGVDATVKVDGYLTLEVTAQDAEGDHLRCLWQTTAADSAFSYSQEVEMEWDAAKARWRAVCCWRPEPDQPGKVYHLECQVRDGRGGVVTGMVGATGTIQVLGHGRMAFSSDRDGNLEIYTMNPDGSDLVRLTREPARDVGPRWSPDGQQILFLSERNGAMEPWVMNRDGSRQRRVLDTGAMGFSVFWMDITGTGNQAAFVGRAAGGTEIFLVNLDGTDPRTGNPGAWQMTHVAWPGQTWAQRGIACHPDGERLVVSGDYLTPTSAGSGDDLYEIRYYDRTTDTWLADPIVTNLTNTPGAIECEPDFNADGTRLIWYGAGATGASWATYTAPAGADGSLGPITHLADTMTESPMFSPDGELFTYQTGGGATRECFIGSLNGSPPVQLTNSLGDDDGTVWSPY